MTHTDRIKALVDLGPELQKRYDSRSVMNPTGSILLTYEEAPTILAAIEALTPIASGTSVVVPVEPTEAICEKLRAVLPELFDTSDDTLREIYIDMLAASPATPERILELEDKLERLGASLQLISCNGHLSGSYLADIARIALKSKEPSPSSVMENEHGK